MPKATWNGAVLAESDRTRAIENNQYFPPESLHLEFFRDSDATTECGWKGTARYYDVVVVGDVNPQAAWYYPEPKPAAEDIRGYVAFWKGVKVEG